MPFLAPDILNTPAPSINPTTHDEKKEGWGVAPEGRARGPPKEMRPKRRDPMDFLFGVPICL